MLESYGWGKEDKYEKAINKNWIIDDAIFAISI